MPTFGTGVSNNLPVTYRFRFGGTDINWGQPYRINTFQNNAESIDGDYRISDLDVQFVDLRGSYFSTQFGNGTKAFGSSLEVIAYLGGTMGYRGTGFATMFSFLGTAGAYVATIHTGKVYGISFADQTLRLRSRNAMALLSDMKFQYPVDNLGLWHVNSSEFVYGSFYFSTTDLRNHFYYGSALYGFEDARSKWQVHAYILATNYDAGLLGNFPAMAGRGTLSNLNSQYCFPGTDASGVNFYSFYDPIKLEGTFIGSFVGTITNDFEAREFGYLNVSVAEATKFNGSIYNVQKSRHTAPGTDLGPYVYFSPYLKLDGNPRTIYEYLMTGAMVTPFFSSNELDTSSLNESGTITAYSSYSRYIGIENDKVLDAIKSLFESTQSLFSVNTANKFEWRAYGPKNLTTTIPSIGTNDVISSSFENNEDDFYNRFIIKYKFDYLSNKYLAKTETKLLTWDKSYDRPLTIEAGWLQSQNEAGILGQRLSARYINTVPRVKFTTNLNSLGYEIGTLLKITDPNSGLLNKTVQLVGFEKNFEDREIDFMALDAETIYLRKGYAFWMGGVSLPGAVVSGTSTSGWGTNGTVNNINGSLYGSQFSWW